MFLNTLWKQHLIMLAIVTAFSSACSAPSRKTNDLDNSDDAPKKELSKQEKAAMLLRVADGALMEGDPTAALAAVFEAENYDTGNAQLYHTKAIAYYRKHDLEKAIEAGRRAVQLAPDFSSAQNSLGKFYLDMGRYSEAQPCLEKAAKDPVFSEAYKARTNLGILFYQTGQYSTAKNHLDIAIRDGGEGACVAHYYRGQISMNDRRYTEAVKDFKKSVVNQCNQFAEAHFALGLAYAKSDRPDDARKKLIEFKKVFPEHELANRAEDLLGQIP